MSEPTCCYCGRRLDWHYVTGKWTHADTRTTWCSMTAQGYDQPRATPRSTS
jgi:hypothetical protein